MAGPCSPTFEQLAKRLGGGFDCKSGHAVLNLRAPWELTNWTLPVIEAVMVGGAAYALVHAVRRYHAGDSTVLSLWFASIVYLFIIEPPLYFPAQIGITGQHELVFAHNVFAVEFLWDRLPLYIIALYPAMITLAFEIVRSLGVFRRYGLVVGAICVGFVHHCFYEVFDQLGPQLRWWIWNPAADPNHPTIAAVPMSSVVLFATVAPAVLAGIVYWLVACRVERGERVNGRSLIWRTVLAGVLMMVASAIGGLPWSVFNTDNPNAPIQIAAMLIELAAFIVVGLVVLPRSWRSTRREATEVDVATRRYVQRHGFTYLAVFAVLWATALPDNLGAVHGITAAGTRTGSVLYATACFVTCVAVVAAVRTAGGNATRVASPVAGLQTVVVEAGPSSAP